MHHDDKVESNKTSTSDAFVEGALIGGAVGAVHATGSALSVGGVIVSPLLIASSMDNYCHANICNTIFGGLSNLWHGAVYFVMANVYLDQIVSQCVTALGMREFTDIELFDAIPKCAIAGAVVGGAGYAAYRFFANQSNQNQQSLCIDKVNKCAH